MKRVPSYRALAAALLLAAAPAAALAGDRGVRPSNPNWAAECGACHIAYPPRFLSAHSWRAMMNRLDRHFGVDASMDGAIARELQQFAESNAASGKRASDPGDLRISETRWFQRKHDEVAPAVWKRPAVKSAANCAACHTEAERDLYSERTVRIPR
jgi:hypothetical protein